MRHGHLLLFFGVRFLSPCPRPPYRDCRAPLSSDQQFGAFLALIQFRFLWYRPPPSSGRLFLFSTFFLAFVLYNPFIKEMAKTAVVER